MKWKISLSRLIPSSLFIAAILIILDQIVRYGVIWEWGQVIHHENLALTLTSVALGMLLSQKISKNERAKTCKTPEQK